MKKNRTCENCGKPVNGYKLCYRCKIQSSIDKDKEKFISEGEEFIEDYLEYYGINFQSQYVLTRLKGDDKKYRVVDFYLDDYDVYIEYDGYWHIDKERYKEKKKVYWKNNIPCIFLYPENLAVLDFILDKRLQKVLDENNMNSELKKYQRFKLWNSEKNRFFIIASLLILIGVLLFMNDEKEGWGIYLLLLAIISYQSYCIVRVYRAIFIHKKYPLHYIEF